MATIDDMRTGLRRSAGLAGSTFVLGVTFGALARAHGGARSKPRRSWTALGSWRTKATGTSAAGCCSAAAAVITAVLLLTLPAGPALLGGAAAVLLGLRTTKPEHSC